MVAKADASTVETTLYLNIVAGEKVFPSQIVIAGSGGEEGSFGSAFIEVMKELLQKPDENTLITYTPRAISSGSNAAPAAATNKPAMASSGLQCPIHNVDFTIKTSRFGEFESCSVKLADDSFCNKKPPKAN